MHSRDTDLLPPFPVQKTPHAHEPAPEHIEDGACWCNPYLVVIKRGVGVIVHRRFEN